MTVLQGKLYDGATSRAYDAALYHVSRNTITLVVGGQHFPMALREIGISPRVGSAARFLALAGKIRFETLNNDGVDKILRQAGISAPNWVATLESGFRLVAVALVLLVLGSLLAVVDVIPRLVQ